MYVRTSFSETMFAHYVSMSHMGTNIHVVVRSHNGISTAEFASSYTKEHPAIKWNVSHT